MRINSSTTQPVQGRLLKILNELPKDERDDILAMHARVDALESMEFCRDCNNDGLDGVRALEIAVRTTVDTIDKALAASPY